jgi:hypothetical protein
MFRVLVKIYKKSKNISQKPNATKKFLTTPLSHRGYYCARKMMHAHNFGRDNIA